jgi:Predicted AAA-ATPase
MRPIPIGIDDFRKLRERGLEYVDKTHLIREIVDPSGVAVALLPRPRRFGKSLNLSMLRWFFEKRDEDLWHLFDGLHIARAGEAYRAHFQRYPVVHLSFKATRADRFEVCQGSIRLMIRELYHQHAALLERGSLDEWERAELLAVLNGSADEAVYRRSLLNLTAILHRAHGERVVVLIDEYDAPIHAGWAHGYYGDIVDFFRGFFEAGLKDNPHLHQGVLTGILRIAKESIFSGLNNLAVYTLLEEELNTCFGFTEAEVAGLLEKAGVPELLAPCAPTRTDTSSAGSRSIIPGRSSTSSRAARRSSSPTGSAPAATSSSRSCSSTTRSRCTRTYGGSWRAGPSRRGSTRTSCSPSCARAPRRCGASSSSPAT